MDTTTAPASADLAARLKALPSDQLMLVYTITGGTGLLLDGAPEDLRPLAVQFIREMLDQEENR